MASAAGPSRPRAVDPRSRHDLVDAETALYSALLNMNLEENGWEEEGKGKELQRRSALMTDADLAVRLAREEAEATARFDADRAFALSLSNDTGGHQQARPPAAVNTTRGAQQPGGARNAAAGLNTRNGSTPGAGQTRSGAQDGTGWLGSVFTSVAKWWYSTPEGGSAGAARPSTTPAQTNVSNQRLTGHTCVVCQDPIRGSEVQALCGHFYDKACTLELFEASIRDESLFPPRCCRQNIPLSRVQNLMTAAALARFTEKSSEYQTLKRVYCSNPRCSRFLGPQLETISLFSRQFLECPAANCSTTTCARCKARVTSSIIHRCQTDRDDSAVLALGARSQWARCPGCAQLIELNLGCYHMTCRCKTEFCYLCRARWKTCRCVQWDENRLMAAAEARVDARLGIGAGQPRAPPAPAQRQPPAPEANRLTEYHTFIQAARDRLRVQNAPVVDPNHPPRIPERTRPTSLINPEPDHPAPHTTTLTAHRLSTANVLALNRSFSRDVVTSAAQTPAAGPSTARDKRPQSQYQPTVTRPSAGPIGDTSHASKSVSRRPVSSQPNKERDRLVREAVEHLRHNHECDHTNWAYRAGGGFCETCQHNFPFIFSGAVVVKYWLATDAVEIDSS